MTTGIDASQLVAITEALRQEGLGDKTIAKVMGGNTLRLLAQQLPRTDQD